MTVIRPNSISGITSVTAQSASLDFYDVSGNTLAIGASVTGNVTGDVTGNVTGDLTGNVTGDVNAGVITATSNIVVGDTFLKTQSVGIGTTTTSGRNAGVSTAIGPIVYNETTGTVEIYKRTLGWVSIDNVGDSIEGMTATGGIVNEYTDPGPGAVYRSHTFVSSGTFDVSALSTTLPNTVDILTVGGGGGGSGSIVSYWAGSGGGAGGMLEVTSYPVSVQTYPVTVGGGGAGSLLQPTWTLRGSTGVDSQFNNPGNTGISVIAKGGGGGGGSATSAPVGEVRDDLGGGSSGGVGSKPGMSPVTSPAIVTHPNNPTITALSGVTLNHYGNVGGSGESGTVGEASGGGGAGGVGESSDSPYSTTQDKSGGAGRSNTWALGPSNPIIYAVGGGGGPANSKGSGLGGNDGTYSRGNGGSGGANPTSAEPGGSGGSGIVVVRYQIGASVASAKATGGAISFYNGKTIHKFTSSSSFVTPASFNETVEYVVIGAGGGGVRDIGGGGGAGAWREGSTPISGSGTHTVTIGSGGAAQFGSSSNSSQDGGSSSIQFPSVITAAGGGGGGSPGVAPNDNGRSGGSGGGGRANRPSSGGTGTGDPYPGSGPQVSPANGWGNDGGGGGVSNPAGGGGGAGKGGGPSSSGGAQNSGGDGLRLPATYRNPQETIGYPGPGGTTGWFAGGGGAAGWPGNPPGGGGGAPSGSSYAGAGAGGAEPPSGPDGGSAGANSGSGGGGGGNINNGGQGGSGIVIVAYPT